MTLGVAPIAFAASETASGRFFARSSTRGALAHGSLATNPSLRKADTRARSRTRTAAVSCDAVAAHRATARIGVEAMIVLGRLKTVERTCPERAEYFSSFLSDWLACASLLCDTRSSSREKYLSWEAESNDPGLDPGFYLIEKPLIRSRSRFRAPRRASCAQGETLVASHGGRKRRGIKK